MRLPRRLLTILPVLVLLASPTSFAEPPERPTASAPDPASVKRHGPAYAFPQDGWTVLHLEGKPYDRGYQHGQLLHREIVEYIRDLSRYRAPKSPADGWKELRNLSNALFLRRYDRELLEEMKGIADGAAAAGARVEGRPLDFLDIVALNSEVECTFVDEALDATQTGLEGQVFREPAESPARDEPESHCSAFAATGPATSDGHPVIGHITMWNLFHARHFNVWLDLKPETGHRILMQTYPGGIMSGMDYYQNDAGIVVCETTLDQTAFNPDGEPVCSRIRRALQHSDSIDGVVAILSEHNNGLYSNEWLMADMKTDEIAMFELGTHKTRLWRSGQNQWFAGVEGFYWGCNNAKDLQVRLDTVPGVQGKPVNVLFHPTDRDRAWLKLYDQWKGRIDVGFGFEAFTTAPLCSSRALDAKFTTAEMADRLESYGIYGPPRGQVWEPTDAERDLYPEIGPLLPHDWTLLSAQAPPAPSAGQPKAVDLEGPSARGSAPSLDARRPPAWHGTILPASDADLWLAAAFADYERIVALEKALGDRRRDRSQIQQALFAPLSKYLSARARSGSDLALANLTFDVRTDAWYDIASGKGVLVLDSLRKQLGAKTFDSAMDQFGRAHAGKTASTDEFFETLEQASGKPLKPPKAAWINSRGFELLDPSVAERFRQGRFWSVTSFEHEPDRLKIVYRTASDSRGHREAAYRLQHLLRTKWSNISAPVMADSDLRESDLSGSHVILIGTPECPDRSLASLSGPVLADRGSFRILGKTYAHPESAVVVAVTNPKDSSYSVVQVLGLSAEATNHAVKALAASRKPSEVLLIEAGGPARPIFVPVSGPVKEARSEPPGGN